MDNLIITDYLSFYLYQNGELRALVSIARLEGWCISPIRDNFEAFYNLLQSFAAHQSPGLASSADLARAMAAKARLLRKIFEQLLERPGELARLLSDYKNKLNPALDESSFADIYAQSIVYALFVAKLIYDDEAGSSVFDKDRAYALLPKNNPFLKRIFNAARTLDEE